jgi:predicted transcriptional regulator
MWISVNPATEKEEIVQAAMALSGWYELGWSECGEYLNYPPLVEELLPEEIADFLDRNPKTIELRKGNFGASLKPGDSIIIYATLPFVQAIGTVKVIKREPLTVDRLWQASEQGRQAKVSRKQFDTYYANQESGVGVWVGAAELLLSSDRTLPTSPELGPSLAATAANSAIERRSNFCTSYNAPLHFSCISKRYGVRDDFTV